MEAEDGTQEHVPIMFDAVEVQHDPSVLEEEREKHRTR